MVFEYNRTKEGSGKGSGTIADIEQKEITLEFSELSLVYEDSEIKENSMIIIDYNGNKGIICEQSDGYLTFTADKVPSNVVTIKLAIINESEGGGNTSDVELTKEEYDELPDSKLTDGKNYYITDWSEEDDVSKVHFKDIEIGTISSWTGNYYTKSYESCGIDTSKYDILCISIINFSGNCLLNTILGNDTAFYILTTSSSVSPTGVKIRIVYKDKE